MRWIALLRGINVSGQKIIRMVDLVKAFEDMGYTDVKTYLQTGNVAFDTPQKVADKIRTHIEVQLHTILGYPVTVVLRSKAEIQALVSLNPFEHITLQAESKPYVVFMADKPTIPATIPITSIRDGVEVFGGNQLDLYALSLPLPKGGYGFPNPYIEKSLKVAATTRNWNTVCKLAV
jgi:uncharacterized protein (DUF1697 family)